MGGEMVYFYTKLSFFKKKEIDFCNKNEIKCNIYMCEVVEYYVITENKKILHQI